MLLDLTKVKVPHEKATDLAQRLSNWDGLHGWLTEEMRDLPPEENLDLVTSLLKVELDTRARLFVSSRLLGIYHRISRSINQRRLAGWLR